jgi:hypothetical protein
VTLKFKPHKSFLDAYVLKGSCMGRECQGHTHGTYGFQVTKGSQWFIVVDAAKVGSGDYSLRIECDWTNQR